MLISFCVYMAGVFKFSVSSRAYTGGCISCYVCWIICKPMGLGYVFIFSLLCF